MLPNEKYVCMYVHAECYENKVSGEVLCVSSDAFVFNMCITSLVTKADMVDKIPLKFSN